jgi:hypothetical protein
MNRISILINRKATMLLMAMLLVITSSPYFVASFIFAHGHHVISPNIENGKVTLVFQHGEHNADHSHDQHHHHDQSTSDDDHRIASIFTGFVSSSSVGTKVVFTHLPVVDFSYFFAKLPEVYQSFPLPHALFALRLRRFAPTSIFRTIVLLI